LTTFFCPCDQQNAVENEPVTYTLPTAFRSITSKQDLDETVRLFPVTLLIGIVGWSNYSRSTFMELTSDQEWFTNRSIGLRIMCLGQPSLIQLISSDVYSHFEKANTEPILYCFVRDALKEVVCDPRKLEEIKNWLL